MQPALLFGAIFPSQLPLSCAKELLSFVKSPCSSRATSWMLWEERNQELNGASEPNPSTSHYSWVAGGHRQLVVLRGWQLCHRSKWSLKFYFQYLHFWIGLKKLQLHTTVKLMIPSRERDGFHFTYYTLKMLPQLQSLSCCNRSVNTQIFHLQLQGEKKNPPRTPWQLMCLTQGDLDSGRKTWEVLLTNLLP